MSEFTGVRHYLFLIHGTWGQDPQGWYHPDVDDGFARRLATRLDGTPLEGALWRDVNVFEWSGENSHEARKAAAEKLALLLLRMRQHRPFENARFHFVAHSHGGNVLLAALQIYLARLPEALLNGLEFPKYITNHKTAEEFHHAANKFEQYVGSRSGPRDVVNDERLIDELKQWGPSKAEARRNFLIGRPNFWGMNKLYLQIALSLLRLGTHGIGHGIASSVFLGTPFYYKRWRTGFWSHAMDRGATALAEAALLAVASYVVLLAGAACLSWLSPVPWIGADPLRWPLALQTLVGLSALAGAVAGVRRLPGAADTNVYFDETMFHERQGSSPLTEVGERHLFDALVVTAGYLDEAYAGLSAFPLMEQITPRLLDRMLAPTPWAFVPLQRAVGTVRLSPGQSLRLRIRSLGRRLRSVALWLLYPARFTVYKLVTRPIVLSQTKRFTRLLSFGLPPDELTASDIIVRDRLEVPQIAARHLDVSKDLVRGRRAADVEARQFEFLWDDDVLAARYGASPIRTHFDTSPAADEQRHLLSIEERVREFFGVAGLRHSLYYESDRVIEAVAEYLMRDAFSTGKASTSESAS